MQQMRWILLAVILVTGAVSANEEPQDHEIDIVKRQSFDVTTQMGPNGEIILVIDGQEVVSIVGNNARNFSIMEGETLVLGEPFRGIIVVDPDGRVGPFTNIRQFTARFCVTVDRTPRGPGILFLSEGLAFFTNDACQEQIIDRVNEIIGVAPPLRINVEVVALIESGRLVSQLRVNDDEFRLALTGAPVSRVGSGELLIFTSTGSLVIRRGTGVESLGSVMTLAGITIGQDGNAMFMIWNTSISAPVTLPGPGWVFVSGDMAIFIEDFSFRGGGVNLIDTINGLIFAQAFRIGANIGGERIITDYRGGEVITLSGETSSSITSLGGELSFSGFGGIGSGAQGVIRFVQSNGRVIVFSGIQMFSTFINNQLQTAGAGMSLSFMLTTGGTFVVDTARNTAFFISDASGAGLSEIRILIDSVTGSTTFSYGVRQNSEGVFYVFVRNSTSGEITRVQTLTGAYCIRVGALQSVTYDNDVVTITDSSGNAVTCIEEVNELVVNTGTLPFSVFMGSSPVPFPGPGTVCYSRGTAFFTTDLTLGNSLEMQSARARIPDIDFMRVNTGNVIIDGENHTTSAIIQRIGGDRVVAYEASCYVTTADQEIFYSDSRVTVHSPIRVGSGNVFYNGGAETLTYRNAQNELQVLMGITNFFDFSGCGVTETQPPQDRALQGPGKLYISDDGMQVLFSTSDIVTFDLAARLRLLQMRPAFEIAADQFSSIFGGVFNLSTNAATVTYRGGGTIWSRRFNGSEESFYVANAGVSAQIQRAVGSFLTFTKSNPAKDDGIVRLIFNGRVVYSYSPIPGNPDALISSTASFEFNGTALTGNTLPGGPYVGIDRVITFDGVKQNEFNASNAPITFNGYGLLLVQSDTGTAFFTRSVPTTNYLLQSITNVRRFLIPPQIQPGRGQITSKLRSVTVDVGTDLTAYEGATVNFFCNVVRGRPEPNVVFIFSPGGGGPDIPLNSSINGITIINNTLTLMPIEIGSFGRYTCRASNGVPPAAEASSVLTVREAVAPRVQPGWYPFRLQSGQQLFWPSDPAITQDFDVHSVEQLVFACRVEGRPKALVMWSFNDQNPEIAASGLVANSINITEISEGRSVLTIDVTANQAILRGTNRIDCLADNAAESPTRGRVILRGVFYDCEGFQDTPCSKTCGFGIRVLDFDCTRDIGGAVTNVDIDDVPFTAVPAEEREGVCSAMNDMSQTILCPITEYRWNTSEWTECSRPCNGGNRSRIVTCLNVSIPISQRYRALINESTETVAEDNMCLMFDAAGARPTERELCNTQSCPFWQTSEFSACSVSCGGGMRQRTVNCVIVIGKYKDMNGKVQLNTTIVDDSECDERDRPAATAACNTHECFFKWNAGQFGDCADIGDPALSDELKYCRLRDVSCVNEENEVVDDSFCAGQARPTTVASCWGGNCFEATVWNALRWSACSVTCGYGIMTREVQCLSSETWTVLSNTDFCDSSKMPPAQQQCFPRNCDRCLRDEIRSCPAIARAGLCGSIDMGESGLRCCVSCMGMAGGD